MLDETMLDKYICPITQQIFRNPITLDDGFTYEQEAIEQWILQNNNNTSPMTRQPIMLHDIMNIEMQQQIDELERQNAFGPELRYVCQHDKTFVLEKLLCMRDKICYIKKYKLNEVVNTKCNNTILHEICKGIKLTLDIIAYIITSGADMNIRNNNGDTPLHVLFNENKSELSYEVFKYLVDCDVNLTVKNYGGYTPLHYMCYYKQTIKYDIIKYSMMKKLPLDIKNDYGDTPLHYLCIYGYMGNIIKTAMDSGYNFETQNRDGVSPLHHLFRNHYSYDDLSYAMIKGYNIDALQTKDGFTPLHYLCDRDFEYSYDIILHAMNKGYKFDGLQTNNGFTPLHFLCDRKYYYSYNIILEAYNKGYNFAIKNTYGYTAYDLAKKRHFRLKFKFINK